MTLALALAATGWVAGVALAAALWTSRHRLLLVARAEHELRGALAALGLGLEGRARRSVDAELTAALELELERARLALADLGAARRGCRATTKPVRVALEPLARACATGWAPVARRRGRELRFDWAAGPVAVAADRGRLVQALGNVLANAAEHGRGRVEVLARRRGSRVRIEVRDEGPGFGDGRVGSPPAGGRDRGSGSKWGGPDSDRGHGLAIAAEAVEEAGGSLGVHSSEHGASVAVELPVVEP